MVRTPFDITYLPMVTSVCIVLRLALKIGNNRKDSLTHALTYGIRFRMSCVIGIVLSGNTNITSSRSFSCFFRLFAI